MLYMISASEWRAGPYEVHPCSERGSAASRVITRSLSAAYWRAGSVVCRPARSLAARRPALSSGPAQHTFSDPEQPRFLRLRLRLQLQANRFGDSGSGSDSDQNVSAPATPAPALAPAPHPCTPVIRTL